MGSALPQLTDCFIGCIYIYKYLFFACYCCTLNKQKVITVSARSKFPKGLDIELPTAPLGSLRIDKNARAAAGNPNIDASRAAAKNAEESAPVGNTGPAADDAETLPNGNNRRSSSDGTREGVARDGGGEGSGEGTRSDGRSVEGETGRDGVSDSLGLGDGVSADVKGGTKQRPEKKTERGSGGAGEGGGGGGEEEVTEMDYCGMLNRVLPPEIRALAWAPVTAGFSARFSCSDRTYRFSLLWGFCICVWFVRCRPKYASRMKILFCA